MRNRHRNRAWGAFEIEAFDGSVQPNRNRHDVYFGMSLPGEPRRAAAGPARAPLLSATESYHA